MTDTSTEHNRSTPIHNATYEPAGPFAAIIFDCDGTLVDTAEVYYRAYSEVVARHGAHMTPQWYVAHLALSADALLRRFFAEFSLSLDPKDLMRPLAEAYRTRLSELAEIETVAAVARRYRGMVPLAVASAGTRDVVEPTLEAAGLLHLFDEIVTIEAVDGRTKPDPALFLEAARRLGVPPADCIVFEDSNEGLEAAHRAGMRATDVRTIHHHAWRANPI